MKSIAFDDVAKNLFSTKYLRSKGYAYTRRMIVYHHDHLNIEVYMHRLRKSGYDVDVIEKQPELINTLGFIPAAILRALATTLLDRLTIKQPTGVFCLRFVKTLNYHYGIDRRLIDGTLGRMLEENILTIGQELESGICRIEINHERLAEILKEQTQIRGLVTAQTILPADGKYLTMT